MSNDIDLATAIFGNKRLEEGVEPTVKILTGTAVSDSVNGKVDVVIDGTVTGEEYDGELQDNIIELDTNPNVKEGDIVQITAYGGVSNSMIVTGVIGSGDKTKADTDEAKKVATNYINFSEEEGLVVGDMTASTLKGNTQIKSDEINIRNGTTTLARFSSNSTSLDSGNFSLSSESIGKYSTSSINSYNNVLSLTCGKSGEDFGALGFGKQSDDMNNSAYIVIGNNSESRQTSLFFENAKNLSIAYFDVENIYKHKNGSSITGEIYGETVLYNSNTGTNGKVSLSESAERFKYLEIYFNYSPTNNVSAPCGYTKVYSPNNKYVSLNMAYQVNTENAIQILTETVQISKTKILRTVSEGWFVNGDVTGSGVNAGRNSALNFYITRVVGIN